VDRALAQSKVFADGGDDERVGLDAREDPAELVGDEERELLRDERQDVVEPAEGLDETWVQLLSKWRHRVADLQEEMNSAELSESPRSRLWGGMYVEGRDILSVKWIGRDDMWQWMKLVNDGAFRVVATKKLWSLRV
jgi:hypothetical protein